MHDNSTDLSAEFDTFLDGIDVPNLGPPRILSPDPDAWDSFLAGIAVPSPEAHATSSNPSDFEAAVAVPTQTTDSQSTSASSEGPHDSTADEYHPSPVQSPVLYIHPDDSSPDEEDGNFNGEISDGSG
jgi:hypothetical protein